MKKNSTIRLYLRSKRLCLVEGLLGKTVTAFGENFYFSPSNWDQPFRYGKLRFSFKFGFYRELSLPLPGQGYIHNLAKKIVLPNPFFIFTWGKVCLPQKHKVLGFESLDSNLSYEQKPPMFDEKFIGTLKESVSSEDKKRILFLCQNKLKLIEDGDEGRKASLFKDLKTESFWQLNYNGENRETSSSLLLSEVTPSQWTYHFIERSQGVEEGEKSKEEFFQVLEDDPNGSVCEIEGCDARGVRYSSLCRNHHFESIYGHPFRGETV